MASSTMTNAQVVEHIIRNKNNYFTVLQVSQGCTAAEVSSAYKKLALKCHPDKNEHPQAVDAFKILGAARDVLSNPQLQQSYIRRGEQGVRNYESNMRNRERPAAANIDPFEQFFNHLFNNNLFEQGNRNRGTYYTWGNPDGGMYNAHTFQRATRPPQQENQRQNQARANNNQPGGFLMFIPLIMFVIMLLGMQSSWEALNPHHSNSQSAYSGVSKDRVFSLTPLPESGMVIRRTTSLYNTDVEYYTSNKHSNLFKKRDFIFRVEREVLKEKQSSLERRCTADRHNHRARGIKTPPESCEDFRRLSSALG